MGTTAKAQTSRTIPAQVEAVWAVLADFGNDTWNSQIKRTTIVGDRATGLGARRHCDLSTPGSLDEEIVAWEEGRLMTIAIGNVKVLPIKSAETSFTLTPRADGQTDVTMSTVAVPKGGPFAGMVVGRLERGLPRSQAGLLAELEAAAMAGVGV